MGCMGSWNYQILSIHLKLRHCIQVVRRLACVGLTWQNNRWRISEHTRSQFQSSPKGISTIVQLISLIRLVLYLLSGAIHNSFFWIVTKLEIRSRFGIYQLIWHFSLPFSRISSFRVCNKHSCLKLLSNWKVQFIYVVQYIEYINPV